MDACVYGGPKWTVSTVYEGMLKEEMDAAAARYPDVPYRPTLIDAAYAGLLTESNATPLVVPALNRDGDCLSDLVLALFGSIAGAESVLLALDDDLRPVVAMAEAPHGTAPSLMGKNVANPMAMLLACAAVLDHAARGDAVVAEAAAAIRLATLGAAADGIRTFDLGGEASTSEVVDEVLLRLRADARELIPAFVPSRGLPTPAERESRLSKAPNLARGPAPREDTGRGGPSGSRPREPAAQACFAGRRDRRRGMALIVRPSASRGHASRSRTDASHTLRRRVFAHADRRTRPLSSTAFPHACGFLTAGGEIRPSRAVRRDRHPCRCAAGRHRSRSEEAEDPALRRSAAPRPG